MKYLQKSIAIVLFFWMIQGCATHEKFIQRYDWWVGQNVTVLIQEIGYPDTTFTLPNGHKVYVYERSNTYNVPASPVITPMFGYGRYYGYYPMAYTQERVTKSCKLFIETDKNGMITRWESRGNDCVNQ